MITGCIVKVNDMIKCPYMWFAMLNPLADFFVFRTGYFLLVFHDLSVSQMYMQHVTQSMNMISTGDFVSYMTVHLWCCWFISDLDVTGFKF